MSDDMPEDIGDDRFDTVAITWSQPEAAVMLSMFEFYGIPAFAMGRLHASVMPGWITALQGIQIRVHAGAVDEALDLLAEVAERPAAVRPVRIAPAVYIALFALALTLAGLAPWPLALIGWAWITLVTTAIPPSRTASTFMLWKRSREAPA